MTITKEEREELAKLAAEAQLESWGREDSAPLKARIAELEAAAAWKPIDTAPEGASLLVAAPGTSVRRAYKLSGEWHESGQGRFWALYFEPTHYRELPEPPKGGA